MGVRRLVWGQEQGQGPEPEVEGLAERFVVEGGMWTKVGDEKAQPVEA